MPNPYKTLFTAEGSFAFSAFGALARMPISMMGIGLITMLAQTEGSYWLAGAVAATFTFTMAIIAPQISWWVDRSGQSRVLPIVTLISACATLLLLVAVMLNFPNWSFFLLAALSGCMPSMSAMVRARWSALYRGTDKLHTAYSFESVIDEVCFIIGPPISVGLCVSVHPVAGPLLAVIFLLVGVFGFVVQKRTEPEVSLDDSAAHQTAIRLPLIQLLAVALFGLGVIVGAIDVISVAFAKQQGVPIAASVVLSLYAVGSCLAGLVFGALRFTQPLSVQFLYAALVTAVTIIPLFWVTDVWMLSVAMFVSGIFFAPTMIIAMAIVENHVSESKLTESLTWLITGLGIGVATGAAATGWVMDHFDVQTGFYVTYLAAALIAVTALIFAKRQGVKAPQMKTECP